MELIFILFVCLVIATIIFALVGFIYTLSAIFGGGSNRREARPTTIPANLERPSLKQDVVSSRRFLEYLRSKDQVTAETYRRLVEFLERKFAAELRESEFPPTATRTASSPPTTAKSAAQSTRESATTASQLAERRSPSGTKPAVPKTAKPAASEDVNQPAVPTPEISREQPAKPALPVGQTPAASPSALTTPFVSAADVEVISATAATTRRGPATVAPWDRPDPEPRAPRRSFAEVMSGFMQEKNMRWGELTSGILIVLSAVGLVVSLRDQLSDAIPYFSSILFMALTGAIIGAGIYTLKKWKLRNTSRGTLIIGLLLVPLNFVAACVLSGGEDRRELSDPSLWLAIMIGVGGFGAMTYWAGKCLLRRNIWPIVVGIVGSGLAAILINRLAGLTESSLNVALLSLPLIACFAIGADVFSKRPREKKYWSSQSTNRLYMVLGISAFAVLSGLSLFLIRSESQLATTVAITPALVVLALVTCWYGAIVEQATWNFALRTHPLSQGERLPTTGSTPHLHSSVQADPANSFQESKIQLLLGRHRVGLTLKILGLLLAGLFAAASITNPTMFVVNCVVLAMGVLAISLHQRAYVLLPVAWATLSAAALAGLNLAVGRFGFDQWTSPSQLRDAFINGQSGLCLLASGGLAAAVQAACARKIADESVSTSVRRFGFLTGGAIFLIGCAIAVVASVVNRDSIFDTMTASGLLLVAGFGLLAVSLRVNRRMPELAGSANIGMILPNLTGGLLLAGLVHVLLWNPTVSTWFDGLTQNIGANWVVVVVVHAVAIGLVATWMRLAVDREILVNWSTLSATVAVAGIFILAPNQTGIATLLMLLLLAAWWSISWCLANGGDGEAERIKNTGIPFAAATAVLIVIAIAELVSRFEWCPVYTQPRHWMIQVIGLSLWAIGWTLLSVVIHRRGAVGRRSDVEVPSRNFNWLVSAYPRCDQVVLHGLVLVIAVFVAASLANGALVELFKDATISFSLADEQVWVFGALAAVSAAMLLMIVEQPTVIKGAAVVVLWTMAWGFGAIPFEDSRSTASAIRWLLPCGGLIAATLMSFRRPVVPAWAMMRNRLQLQGKSTWAKPHTQSLINFALAIVVVFVLLLSTITVAQVMLNGAASLGGPVADSWFGRMDKVVSFGIPVALAVTSFLVYAISERRPWLATAGSTVFQYMVVLAIVLLFLSPDPRLASAWFVRVLQSVSLGMTAYGFAWYFMRDRVESADPNQLAAQPAKRSWISQIEVHTLINGLLVTSLAILVYGRFFFVPDQPGDWINSVGKLLGIAAWIAFACLAFSVWREKLSQAHATAHWMWLVGWMGLVLVAMIAAVVDYNFEKQNVAAPWFAFRILAAGTVAAGLVQGGWLWIGGSILRGRAGSGDSGAALGETFGRASAGSGDPRTARTSRQTSHAVIWPLLATAAVGLAFSIRGHWGDGGTFFWFYFVLAALIVGFLFVAGLVSRKTSLTFAAVGIAPVLAGMLLDGRSNWFNSNRPDGINLTVMIWVALAFSNLIFYLYQRNIQRQSNHRSFVCMPNVVLLLSSIWLLLGGLLQIVTSGTNFLADSSLANPLGIGAIVLVVGLLGISLWNDRRRFWVIGFCLTTIGIAMTIGSILATGDESRVVIVLFACGLMLAGWGAIRRSNLITKTKSYGAPRLCALRNAMDTQLPIYSTIMAAILLLVAGVCIFAIEDRPLRYLTAATPLAIAIGFGCLSNPSSRRWLQIVSLIWVTLGCLFFGWADLSPDQMTKGSQLSLLVRSLLVLAGMMFIYGGLVTRWVREGDSWLKSLREMAAVICGVAILFLLLVLVVEATEFQESVGCGLSIAEAASVAVVVIAMIVGLISIAVRPERDPFALSLKGRQGYVYVAQLVTAGLVIHLYLTMPWLFQIGIKEYWPYIAMLICFGGVGVAHLLEKRNLTVLGDPLFTTAALLPVLTAAAIFAIDSKARPEIVMLMVGMAYLVISYTHKSVLSGVAAVLFGNLALWLFYGNFPQFSFFEHPQLWLIPPAVSALIAGQLSRASLTKSQLATLRYVCSAIIYVSSTSEIFISGLGENLWPPMILALLAVGGIMAGILLQIRSFLYLSSLFLLMAMITMVAHAHQRFEHVWPWWAFGITLGIAILVMFGMFEKKKNEMKAIAGRLREWDV